MADPSVFVQPGDQHFWVHHLSPFAIQFSQGFGIRWYGLAYLAGIAWGFWMLWRWSRVGRAPLRAQQIQDFVLFGGLGMIIGGRLGYCLFYAPDLLMDNPFGRMGRFDGTDDRFLTGHEDPLAGHEIRSRFEFPYLFQVWNGGMASHGGIIGMVLGCWLYARRNRLSFGVLADIVAATAPMGIAFGRIANFINGELWGRPSHVPWAVVFPGATRVGVYDVPRHPSQLYAAFLEGFVLLAIALPLHARHRRPGLTCGTVLCCYAIGRFADECFREPDRGQPGSPGHDAILGFMSKGQAYTIPVFLIGFAWMVWALTRPPRPELYLPPGLPPVAAPPAPPAAPSP